MEYVIGMYVNLLYNVKLPVGLTEPIHHVGSFIIGHKALYKATTKKAKKDPIVCMVFTCTIVCSVPSSFSRLGILKMKMNREWLCFYL